MSERAPTSHDVAREAGVSQSAVSRTFTPGASVSPEMRERIEAVALRLGYRPNRLPGIMRRGRSGIIAVVVGGLYNPFHTMTLDSFTRALAAAGKQTMLVRVEDDRDLDEAVGDLVSLRIDGVLSALSVSSQRIADILDRHRLPIVTLNSTIASAWVRTVNSDNAEAGRQAAGLLHACGGTRFASIMGPAATLSHGDRASGFAAALRSLGISPLAAAHGGYDHNWGYEEATRLLERPERPDAVFCGNDLIAAGVVDRWAQAGLTAPDDFKIIGYDNIPIAAWPSYALTTFDQNSDYMAERAIAMFDNFDAPAPAFVASTLIRRRSC